MVTLSPFVNKVVLYDLRRLWTSLVTNNSLLTLDSLDRAPTSPAMPSEHNCHPRYNAPRGEASRGEVMMAW